MKNGLTKSTNETTKPTHNSRGLDPPVRHNCSDGGHDTGSIAHTDHDDNATLRQQQRPVFARDKPAPNAETAPGHNLQRGPGRQAAGTKKVNDMLMGKARNRQQPYTSHYKSDPMHPPTPCESAGMIRFPRDSRDVELLRPDVAPSARCASTPCVGQERQAPSSDQHAR